MKSETGVGSVGKSGRGSSIGCLVGAGLFSRGRGRFICSIVSVSGSDFRCREGDFRALMAVCSVFVIVLSRAFLSALVHLVPCLSPLVVSLWRVGCRPVSRPACLVVGAVRRRAVACLSVSLRLWGGRCCPISSRSCFSPVRYGERGGGVSSIPSCLLGGGDGVYVRGVPCLSRLPCDCLSPADTDASNEIRLSNGCGWTLSCVARCLLAVSSRPAFRQGGRGGRRGER